MRKWFFILVFLLMPLSAQAVHPDEILKDAALESRARVISRQLRCLVCQGEDIDESAAPLASDLRRLVRQRLTAGDTDAEVLQFVQERYGDFVLMNPPVTPRNLYIVVPAGNRAAGRYCTRVTAGRLSKVLNIPDVYRSAAGAVGVFRSCGRKTGPSPPEDVL